MAGAVDDSTINIVVVIIIFYCMLFSSRVMIRVRVRFSVFVDFRGYERLHYFLLWL